MKLVVIVFEASVSLLFIALVFHDNLYNLLTLSCSLLVSTRRLYRYSLNDPLYISQVVPVAQNRARELL
jgi:hypothetical protein